VSLKIEREKRSVALFKPEDRRQMAELLEAINTAATEAGPKRIGDTDENSPVHLAAVAYDEFKAKALKRATKVGITALKGKAWRALLTEHLPRKDVLDDEGEVVESWPQDAQAGFNVDTMALPLVCSASTPTSSSRPLTSRSSSTTCRIPTSRASTPRPSG
jgi:hypothetical protein